jgi:hypothetical protein
VALPDRPYHILYWDTGLKPELLQGLGELTVTTAQMEELLHKIYWKYAGLKGDQRPNSD